MMGSLYDAPKHDITALSSTSDTISMESVTTGGDNDLFSALRVESSPPFLALLTAVMAITFLSRPQIYCAREFYRHCFGSCSWWLTPAKWMLDLIWLVMDGVTVAAITYFLFVFSGLTNVTDHWYLAIYILFILYLAFRWFWMQGFWNWHDKKSFKGEATQYTWEASVALGFAILFILLAWAAITIMAVLFAIEGVWVSFGLILALWVWLTLLAIWTIMVYNCLPKCPRTCKTACPTTLYGKKNKNSLI